MSAEAGKETQAKVRSVVSSAADFMIWILNELSDEGDTLNQVGAWIKLQIIAAKNGTKPLILLVPASHSCADSR